jgi:hypothetical protein
MRAGLFSDGGKRERRLAEARAAKEARKRGETPPPPAAEENEIEPL